MRAPSAAPAAPSEVWLVRVSGRVQGVGYREACVREARRLALAGWVRNRSDGTVEVLAQGRVERLTRLHAWLRQGPPAARVERVEIVRQEPPEPPEPPAPQTFERRPTE
ncbi:MAG: acylphosphatase [Rubrivivax sp.]